MRPAITVALIFIEIFLTPYSAGDAPVADETFDVVLKKYGEPGITLPEQDREFIQKLPQTEWKSAVKHYNGVYKKMFKAEEEKSKAVAENTELKLTTPVYHFHCAVTKAKNLLQFFINLIGNNDPIDHLPLIPNFDLILIYKQSQYDGRFTDTNKFRKRVSRWYYFIQKTKNQIAERIKENLKSYQEEHENVFKSMDDLYPAFYASVARSSFLFNYLYHAFILRMDNTDFDEDEDAFYKFLEFTSPFYYFDETDVIFLNILVISHYPEDNKINAKRLFKSVKTKFKPNVLNSYINYKNRIIVLPQSNDCPKLKIDSTDLPLPFSTTIQPNQ